jgi:Ran GTPase-activating protein (RanGAP) involved in mRNA processing and transport
MALALKPDPSQPNASNKCLKVLDLSYNPISEKAVKYLAEMMETNRTLEYLGLAKCKLENSHILPLFS